MKQKTTINPTPSTTWVIFNDAILSRVNTDENVLYMSFVWKTLRIEGTWYLLPCVPEARKGFLFPRSPIPPGPLVPRVSIFKPIKRIPWARIANIVSKVSWIADVQTRNVCRPKIIGRLRCVKKEADIQFLDGECLKESVVCQILLMAREEGYPMSSFITMYIPSHTWSFGGTCIARFQLISTHLSRSHSAPW